MSRVADPRNSRRRRAQLLKLYHADRGYCCVCGLSVQRARDGSALAPAIYRGQGEPHLAHRMCADAARGR